MLTPKGSPKPTTKMTGEGDLKELAINLQAAIAKARRLNLPNSAYILSMPLTEVSQARQAFATYAEKNAALPPRAPDFCRRHEREPAICKCSESNRELHSRPVSQRGSDAKGHSIARA